jgi:DNA recombination protein RmuC
MDFVILFIPNEMIFSYIYENMNDVWEEAIREKVILAGPFTFTAILRMIKQSYSNFRYQENIHTIIALIHQFSQEFEKYNDGIVELGKRINKTTEQFEFVNSTRTRQLNRIVDKIENEKIDAIESNKD